MSAMRGTLLRSGRLEHGLNRSLAVESGGNVEPHCVAQESHGVQALAHRRLIAQESGDNRAVLLRLFTVCLVSASRCGDITSVQAPASDPCIS